MYSSQQSMNVQWADVLQLENIENGKSLQIIMNLINYI